MAIKLILHNLPRGLIFSVNNTQAGHPKQSILYRK